MHTKGATDLALALANYECLRLRMDRFRFMKCNETGGGVKTESEVVTIVNDYGPPQYSQERYNIEAARKQHDTIPDYSVYKLSART